MKLICICMLVYDFGPSHNYTFIHGCIQIYVSLIDVLKMYLMYYFFSECVHELGLWVRDKMSYCTLPCERNVRACLICIL